MNQKKSLQELTFKDNFMFGAVLLDPENCKGVIERSIGTEIERVEVSREKTIVYNPEYKGIRLDAYAKDENKTRYNVEMQVLQKPALQKRVRYYHSQIDMEVLFSGMPYEELPDTYVIFICDFDPFGEGKYRYTKKEICKEVPQLEMNDGAHTIFLSTKGTNEDEVSKELVKFLEFVGAKPSESEKDYEDAFVARLQESVKEVKASREMGARYMTFQELLRDERAEGKAESILVLLQEIGSVSDELQNRIMSEKDIQTITRWIKLAAQSETIEEFLSRMGAMEYTAKCFSSERYTLLQNSSRGHSVPIIDGKAQKGGRKAHANVVEVSDTKFAMELQEAYETDLSKIKRTFEMLDTGITMTDEYDTIEGHKITERFISLMEPKVEGNFLRIGNVVLKADTYASISKDAVRDKKGKDVPVWLIDYEVTDKAFVMEIQVEGQ